MEMDINELILNMQAYEQEVVASDPGEGLTISTVQTLITLYQKAVEYYSAMDDDRYIDVRNRMQSLLGRPDVEALMSSAQEERKPKVDHSALEEEKVEVKREVQFEIGDDDEDEEAEEEKATLDEESKRQEDAEPAAAEKASDEVLPEDDQ